MSIRNIGRILVVDDNQGVRRALDFVLKSFFEEVKFLSSPVTLLRVIEETEPDVVLLDMNFSSDINNGSEGLYWLREIKSKFPGTSVVLFTAYADIDLAVEGMKQGAEDFVIKPWDNSKLVSTLRGVIAKGKKVSAKSQADIFKGDSARMKDIWRMVNKLSTTEADVQIVGEPGTGRRLVATELFRLSEAGKGDLKVLNKDNYRDFPLDVLQGETVLFANIDDLPDSERDEFLDNLHENDVRILVTAQGDIGRDNMVRIDLPPLRVRKDDIAGMANHFIRESNKRHNRMVDGIDDDAVDLLKRYSWKGNVRELKDLMDKVVVMTDENIIGRRMLIDELGADAEILGDVKGLAEEDEITIIKRALEKTGNNVSAAAKLLKISRPTLYSKISKYKL